MGTTHLGSMGHVDRKVQFVISHPKYDSKLNWDYDLALLRFKEPVKFDSNLIPICLPDDDNEDFAGQTGWVTGWGQLNERGKEFSIIFFCLIFMKIRHKICGSMDGTQVITMVFS